MFMMQNLRDARRNMTTHARGHQRSAQIIIILHIRTYGRRDGAQQQMERAIRHQSMAHRCAPTAMIVRPSWHQCATPRAAANAPRGSSACHSPRMDTQSPSRLSIVRQVQCTQSTIRIPERHAGRSSIIDDPSHKI